MLKKLLICLFFWVACRPDPPPTPTIPSPTPYQLTLTPSPVLRPTPMTAPATPTPVKITSHCGEQFQVAQKQWQPAYTPSNSGVQSLHIRSLFMGREVLWVGYAAGIGLGYFDGKFWGFCRQFAHINTLLEDTDGRLWVGTDSGNELTHSGGLWVFHENEWKNWTDSLPDHRIYRIRQFQHTVYVATWKGMAAYNLESQTWSQPYLPADSIHWEAIHDFLILEDEAWFGSISHGLSWLHEAEWFAVTAPDSSQPSSFEVLDSNQVRVISLTPDGEKVWIGSDVLSEDHELVGLILYNRESEQWRKLSSPDNRVMDIKFDSSGRAWIATLSATFFLGEDEVWYDVGVYWPSLSLAFGCAQNCAFSEEYLFVATGGNGLMHVGVPQHVKDMQIARQP